MRQSPRLTSRSDGVKSIFFGATGLTRARFFSFLFMCVCIHPHITKKRREKKKHNSPQCVASTVACVRYRMCIIRTHAHINICMYLPIYRHIHTEGICYKCPRKRVSRAAILYEIYIYAWPGIILGGCMRMRVYGRERFPSGRCLFYILFFPYIFLCVRACVFVDGDARSLCVAVTFARRRGDDNGGYTQRPRRRRTDAGHRWLPAHSPGSGRARHIASERSARKSRLISLICRRTLDTFWPHRKHMPSRVRVFFSGDFANAPAL